MRFRHYSILYTIDICIIEYYRVTIVLYSFFICFKSSLCPWPIHSQLFSVMLSMSLSIFFLSGEYPTCPGCGRRRHRPEVAWTRGRPARRLRVGAGGSLTPVPFIGAPRAEKVPPPFSNFYFLHPFVLRPLLFTPSSNFILFSPRQIFFCPSPNRNFPQVVGYAMRTRVSDPH